MKEIMYAWKEEKISSSWPTNSNTDFNYLLLNIETPNANNESEVLDIGRACLSVRR